MIELKKIKTGDAEYARVEHLFGTAFPPEERRSREDQRRVTDENPFFITYALNQEGAFVGFVTCWQGPDFVYVEHFATVPEVRGKGIGSEVLGLLAQQYTVPLVLEVELPVEELAQRRIGFYRRNGFVLWENSPYVQPPYQKECHPIALYLMVRGEGLDEAADFERIKRWLYTEVYRCNDFDLTLPEGGK